MNRSTYCFLWLTVIASTSPIGAQVPAAATTQPIVVAIPQTPAGDALREWLAAFNSGDTALLGAYQRRLEPELTINDELSFREQTGGFELLSIERGEPRHMEFTVRERNSPMTAFGVLDVSSAASRRTMRSAVCAVCRRWGRMSRQPRYASMTRLAHER